MAKNANIRSGESSTVKPGRVPSAGGLVIVGTAVGCGKTVLLTGLAATLKSQGFSLRAIKPICYGDKNLAQAELTFISSISHSPLNYTIQSIDRHKLLDAFALKEAVLTCKRGTELTMVELPGSPAQPISVVEGHLVDVADFAKELRWPVLLAGVREPLLYEKAVLSTSYLQSKELSVLGLVAVDTSPICEEESLSCASGLFDLAFKEKTGVNFLGSLAYSPSIDVANVKQGNLIKTTSCGLDLLPILKGLKLSVSV